ncbi:nucleotide exchange factor GrpE [Mycoplasmopsis verecunda]|uniref:Protein GrpE n=1 Tax=Mycoplasmopsis verecunda TaxID=171291 RepID=A0A1T4L1P5_9BACT|nr:nucleotide exchange factor GrpE [Mycoplasmopsis verecunda]WPB54380.1 nucleotide exchange factor GrpE [Mycoplasmopsis verecunda]SJZ48629.1 molecular chaperone GrpE [Mycoplasmopsis verecunda]
MNSSKLNLGDTLSGNFTLFIDDKIVKEYTKQLEIKLGKEQYLPNFDQYLVNRKVKSNLEVKLSFPKNYEIEELGGKKAKVVIEEIKVKHTTHDKHEEHNKNEHVHNTRITELEKEVADLKAKLFEKDHKMLIQEYAFKEKLESIQSKAKEKLEAEQAHMHQKLKNEKNEIKKYALQSFFEDFIEPFNNLLAATNAGISSDNEVVKNYCYGFSIVVKQFTNLLEENGALIIQPEIGQEFNPEKEEVIDFVKDETKANNTIIRVVRLGLSIDSRLVKPAGVVVVKND